VVPSHTYSPPESEFGKSAREKLVKSWENGINAQPQLDGHDKRRSQCIPIELRCPAKTPWQLTTLPMGSNPIQWWRYESLTGTANYAEMVWADPAV
jgi:hypothetical protein